MYDLELDHAAAEIKKNKAKTVCIQLPNGLKPEAGNISRYLEQKTGARIIIWLGSCFGACDIPIGLEKAKIDMLIQWGHSEWR